MQPENPVLPRVPAVVTRVHVHHHFVRACAPQRFRARDKSVFKKVDGDHEVVGITWDADFNSSLNQNGFDIYARSMRLYAREETRQLIMVKGWYGGSYDVG